MTRRTQGQNNPRKPGEPIPFDEALRRLVNTPPKHRTKKEGGTKKRRPLRVTRSD